MLEDHKSWMKKAWSIRIELIGRGSEGRSYIAYSTAKPFVSTPEEAQQALEDLRSKIMSICVAGRDNLAPIVAYEREAGGELTFHSSYYPRDGSRENKALDRRWFRAEVDEVLIPSDVLRRSLVRLMLLVEI